MENNQKQQKLLLGYYKIYVFGHKQIYNQNTKVIENITGTDNPKSESIIS